MKQSWGTGDGGMYSPAQKRLLWAHLAAQGWGVCRWGHCETPARLSVLYVNGRR